MLAVDFTIFSKRRMDSSSHRKPDDLKVFHFAYCSSWSILFPAPSCLWTLRWHAVKSLKSKCIWKVFPVQPYHLCSLVMVFISDYGSGFVPFEKKRASDHSLLYLLWCVSPEELKAFNLLYESVLFSQFIFVIFWKQVLYRMPATACICAYVRYKVWTEVILIFNHIRGILCMCKWV